MVDQWQQTSEEVVGDFKIFELSRVKRISPRTGREHQFFVLDAPDWINIIPVTPEGNVVFVHQVRHGTGRITMEVPGGMVDPHEDDPTDAAVREMMEETGYAAESVVKLGQVEPNPAFLTNYCHSYLALNVRQVKTPEFDGSEDIAIEEVPLERVHDLIVSGTIQHALTINAFFFLERWREQGGKLG